MNTFTDGKGRNWEIVIDVAQVKKLRSVLNVDIDAVATKDGYAKVFSDIVLFIDVIYVLCQNECKARGLTDEDFGKGMVGNPLDGAKNAFMEAVADFFPEYRRKILRAMMAKAQTMEAESMTKALGIIDNLKLEDLIA